MFVCLFVINSFFPLKKKTKIKKKKNRHMDDLMRSAEGRGGGGGGLLGDEDLYESSDEEDLEYEEELLERAQGFVVGGKLEARDIQNPSMICVATVR